MKNQLSIANSTEVDHSVIDSSAANNLANNLLNSCIQIEKTRVSRQLSIPQQISFQLDAHTLRQIKRIKSQNLKLTVSPSNLADLRYYVLLNTPLAKQIQLQSALTFTSNYLAASSQASTAVMRSLISLEGQISHQILQDLWQNPHLRSEVIESHHWLVQQILNQLPLKAKAEIKLWTGYFWLATLTILGIGLWFILPFTHLLKILIIGLSFFVLTKYLKKAVKSQFKLWVVNSLHHGSWANNSRKRQIAWHIIAALS